MSARITVASLAADLATLKETVAAQRAATDEMRESLAVIAASIKVDAPAKVVAARRVAAPARRVAAPKAAKVATAKCLCKATRLAFIAAAKAEGNDLSGLGTATIAAMCVETPALVPAGFRIGEGYTAKFTA